MKQHLKHKDHGFHIAYSADEINRCKKLGWTDCDMAKEHEKDRKAKAKAAKEALAKLDEK